jgi:hypothetical protein
MTTTLAAKQLDEIRNNRGDSSADLLARVDEIGAWLAGQKHSGKVAMLLRECHRLADQLQGGNGKGGVRIQIQ